MLLRTIATGSSGNSYVLISNTGEILLLDLGVSEKTIKKGIDWKISNVVGAAISHQEDFSTIYYMRTSGTFSYIKVYVNSDTFPTP